MAEPASALIDLGGNASTVVNRAVGSNPGSVRATVRPMTSSGRRTPAMDTLAAVEARVDRDGERRTRAAWGRLARGCLGAARPGRAPHRGFPPGRGGIDPGSRGGGSGPGSSSSGTPDRPDRVGGGVEWRRGRRCSDPRRGVRVHGVEQSRVGIGLVGELRDWPARLRPLGRRRAPLAGPVRRVGTGDRIAVGRRDEPRRQRPEQRTGNGTGSSLAGRAPSGPGTGPGRRHAVGLEDGRTVLISRSGWISRSRHPAGRGRALPRWAEGHRTHRRGRGRAGIGTSGSGNGGPYASASGRQPGSTNGGQPTAVGTDQPAAANGQPGGGTTPAGKDGNEPPDLGFAPYAGGPSAPVESAGSRARRRMAGRRRQAARATSRRMHRPAPTVPALAPRRTPRSPVRPGRLQRLGRLDSTSRQSGPRPARRRGRSRRHRHRPRA